MKKKAYHAAASANKSWRMAIEDPFELSHDLGGVIFSQEAQELMESKLIAANVDVRSGAMQSALRKHSVRKMETSGDEPKPTKAGLPQLMKRLCYNCGEEGHNAAECEEEEWVESDDDGE